VQQIIPDIKFINNGLKSIAPILECDEIYLVERNTLLKIGSFVKN